MRYQRQIDSNSETRVFNSSIPQQRESFLDVRKCGLNLISVCQVDYVLNWQGSQPLLARLTQNIVNPLDSLLDNQNETQTHFGYVYIYILLFWVWVVVYIICIYLNNRQQKTTFQIVLVQIVAPTPLKNIGFGIVCTAVTLYYYPQPTLISNFFYIFALCPEITKKNTRSFTAALMLRISVLSLIRSIGTREHTVMGTTKMFLICLTDP